MIWVEVDTGVDACEIWQRGAAGERVGLSPLGCLVRSGGTPIWLPNVRLDELVQGGQP